jgi:hypothetical protein
MAMINYIKKFKAEEYLILLISFVFQLVYFFSVRISFECDSGAYYNTAVGYFTRNESLVSPYRGPTYPFLLKFFGLIDYGWIYPLLIFQFILGCLMPLIFYRIVSKVNKSFAIFSVVLFIASAIPFTSAKLILAEQTFIFFIVLSVYQLQKFLINSNYRNLFLFVVPLLIACFTRWEGLALVAGSIAVFSLNSIKDRSFSKYLIALLLSLGLVFSTYAGLRAYFANDIKLFSLQNGTGGQWIWRQYYSQGFRDFEGEIEKATGAFKGRNIQSLYDLTVTYVNENDNEFYELLKTAEDSRNLDFDDVQKMPNTISNIEILINDAWNEATVSGSHIAFIMNRAAVSKFGLARSDRFLQRAAVDILTAEPNARRVVLDQGLSLIGFGETGFGNLNLSQRIQWFEGPSLNIGGCLQATKNESFISNHNAMYHFYSDTVHKYSSITRNLVRATFPFLLIVWLFGSIRFRKASMLSSILMVSLFTNIAIVSVTGGGPWGKYDLTIFTYLILSVFTNPYILMKKFKQN